MKLHSRIVAAGLALALVLAGSVAAHADDVEFTTPVLSITPTSGNVADPQFLQSIAANVGAPVGSRASSAAWLFQFGAPIAQVSDLRVPSLSPTFGTFGFDGQPWQADRSVEPDNGFVSTGPLVPYLSTGTVELRNYWSANPAGPDLANDPYVMLALHFDAATGDWSVMPAPRETSVSLTASYEGDGVVKLVATVKDALTGIPLSPQSPIVFGFAVFREGDDDLLTRQLSIINPQATVYLSGVADGVHTYTVEYIETPNDYLYFGSVSGPATVLVQPFAPTPGIGSTQILVTVPSQVGSLTLTGVTSTVDLGSAALAGGTLNADGVVSAVVTDTRQLDYPEWSLTGSIGNFVSGDHSLGGEYLGWTPQVSGDAANSSAGPIVLPAPGSAQGLLTSSILATGGPSGGGTITNASALLQLRAPANTPAGVYSTTLTLTLI